MKVLFVHLSKLAYNTRMLRAAPLTYPLLAAYTPPDIDVAIVDEAFEPLDYNDEADLIAITFVVPLATRAYEVAREFRARGKTVVCGGPHASLLPEDAAKHFDAVVVGEGDIIWPQLLDDFKNGRLHPLYRNSANIDPERIPFARRELLNPKGYSILNTYQATRGCPFTCSYCTTRSIYNGFTTRPVRHVIQEIEQARGNSLQRRIILFWDDNLIGNPQWAKELFREMIPLNKYWIGQLTFTITKDADLVRLAAKSGCKGLFLGLESFNQNSLTNADKSFNVVEQYREGIQRLHDYGIPVYGAVMLGFEDDRPDIFRITLDRMIEIGIDMVSSKIVVPYPNTPWYRELQREKRLLPTDWSKYNGEHVVFKPRNMSVEQLKEGFAWFNREFHTFRSISKRLMTSKTMPWITLPINLMKRRATLNGTAAD